MNGMNNDFNGDTYKMTFSNVEHPINSIYREVSAIKDAPLSMWKYVPKYILNVLYHFVPTINTHNSLYYKLLETSNRIYYIIATEIANENVFSYDLTEPSGKKATVLVISDKFYSGELTYSKHISVVFDLFTYILKKENIFDYNILNIYAPYVMILHYIKYNKPNNHYDYEKLISDLKLDKMIITILKHGKELIDLCSHIDYPIKDLLYENGIYILFEKGEIR